MTPARRRASGNKEPTTPAPKDSTQDAPIDTPASKGPTTPAPEDDAQKAPIDTPASQAPVDTPPGQESKGSAGNDGNREASTGDAGGRSAPPPTRSQALHPERVWPD